MGENPYEAPVEAPTPITRQERIQATISIILNALAASSFLISLAFLGIVVIEPSMWALRLSCMSISVMTGTALLLMARSVSHSIWSKPVGIGLLLLLVALAGIVLVDQYLI
jgi:hypothetical protein